MGIPTVTDRIAQMVVVMLLESGLDAIFHIDSYGYRPSKSAHGAIDQARKRCWKYDWVLDLDIKGFFDNIDHALLNKALERHTEDPWVIMYVNRWLTVPYQTKEGKHIPRVYSSDAQIALGCTPIEDVEIPLKTRAHLAALAEALQYIYTHPQWNERIFNLLSDKIINGKKQSGRSAHRLYGGQTV